EQAPPPRATSRRSCSWFLDGRARRARRTGRRHGRMPRSPHGTLAAVGVVTPSTFRAPGRAGHVPGLLARTRLVLLEPKSRHVQAPEHPGGGFDDMAPRIHRPLPHRGAAVSAYALVRLVVLRIAHGITSCSAPGNESR